jgi:hypothetical protein
MNVVRIKTSEGILVDLNLEQILFIEIRHHVENEGEVVDEARIVLPNYHIDVGAYELERIEQLIGVKFAEEGE